MPVASLTSIIGGHGLYAVFGLMVAAAILPAASEVTMAYGGAVAGGAFAGAQITLGGHRFGYGLAAYLAVVVAGLAGNILGAVLGWAIGDYGGRPLLERHGRWLHVTPARIDRAERWFERFGRIAVPVGFATPIVRSFVAIPAGVAEVPLPRLVAEAILGCIPFCFGLAGLGWALGRNYGRFHTALDIAVVAGIVALAAYWVLRRRRSSRLARRASDTTR